MDDLSIECSLQDAFAIAGRVNDSPPLVRLAYADGRATFTSGGDARALEERVLAARAEVLGAPSPVPLT